MLLFPGDDCDNGVVTEEIYIAGVSLWEAHFFNFVILRRGRFAAAPFTVCKTLYIVV